MHTLPLAQHAQRRIISDPMIDTFSIVLSHGLLAIMLWRLLQRPDLDHEDGSDFADPAQENVEPSPKSGWHRPVSGSASKGFRDRA